MTHSSGDLAKAAGIGLTTATKFIDALAEYNLVPPVRRNVKNHRALTPEQFDILLAVAKREKKYPGLNANIAAELTLRQTQLETDPSITPASSQQPDGQTSASENAVADSGGTSRTNDQFRDSESIGTAGGVKLEPISGSEHSAVGSADEDLNREVQPGVARGIAKMSTLLVAMRFTASAICTIAKLIVALLKSLWAFMSENKSKLSYTLYNDPYFTRLRASDQKKYCSRRLAGVYISLFTAVICGLLLSTHLVTLHPLMVRIGLGSTQGTQLLSAFLVMTFIYCTVSSIVVLITTPDPASMK